MSETAHVIKKEDQAGVVSTSFDASMSASTAHRIPAERTSLQREAEDDASSTPPSEGRVLRRRETRRSPEPVTVDPDPFTADVPVASSASDAEATVSDDETAEADDTPSRTDDEWQAHLEEAVAAARAEGYEEGQADGYESGYAEAEEAVRAEARAQREALVEDAARLDAVWARYVEEREPMLIELALELAEAIVDAPLTDSLRTASEEALAEAVAELSGTPPVTVHVHPSDYERLRETELAQRLEATCEELQWAPDADRGEGDWSVVSPAGAIRRLRSEVVETLRSHLGLSAPDRA